MKSLSSLFTCALTCALLVSASSFAEAHPPKEEKKKKPGIHSPRRMPPAVRKLCRSVGLQDEQRAAIVSLRKQTRKTVREIRKNELRPAMKEMRAVLNDPTATLEVASLAQQKVRAARQKIATQRLETRNSILFEIARPEQRAKLAQCMRARKVVRSAKRSKRQLRRMLRRLNTQAQKKQVEKSIEVGETEITSEEDAEDKA